MMRDVPHIFISMFLGMVALVTAMVWYLDGFETDYEVFGLNAALRTAATSEVDNASRVYNGVVFLSPSFETTLWDEISRVYPGGTYVMFDYVFDDTDSRFPGVTRRVASDIYRIGSGETPHTADLSYLRHQPLEAVRILVRLPDDQVSDWTYTSTVTVDFPATSGPMQQFVQSRQMLRLINGALAEHSDTGAFSDETKQTLDTALSGVSATNVSVSLLQSKRTEYLAAKHSAEAVLDDQDE